MYDNKQSANLLQCYKYHKICFRSSQTPTQEVPITAANRTWVLTGSSSDAEFVYLLKTCIMVTCIVIGVLCIGKMLFGMRGAPRPAAEAMVASGYLDDDSDSEMY